MLSSVYCRMILAGHCANQNMGNVLINTTFRQLFGSKLASQCFILVMNFMQYKYFRRCKIYYSCVLRMVPSIVLYSLFLSAVIWFIVYNAICVRELLYYKCKYLYILYVYNDWFIELIIIRVVIWTLDKPKASLFTAN